MRRRFGFQHRLALRLGARLLGVGARLSGVSVGQSRKLTDAVDAVRRAGG